MIFDLHNDILTSALSADYITKYISNLSADSNVCAVLAVYTTELGNSAQNIFDAAQTKIERLNSMRIFTAIEDAGSLDYERIDFTLYKKLLYTSLTWNYENALSGGAFTDIGLKQAGKGIINKLNSAGITLDTAHLSRRAFYDCLDIDVKILCTHTACDALFKHGRNLTDGQISELIDRGGVVGIAFVRQFMTDGQFSSKNIAAHIDHIVQRHGIGSVCIGSDFFGASDMPADLQDYSMMHNLTKRLENLGYSEGEINSVMYLNARRFFGLCEK